MRSSKETKYLAAFGKRLAEIRRAKGFTQESLAEKADVTALTVAYIEQGRQWPRIATLHNLAKSLGVPVSELFKGL
ncbi:MAG TPA: helix-turn-helix transcriptional regulator [Candidatus Saccharimonadales bacterium]|nr:helix-turn-helix transcriptional regulator [Candidatus Saccharimonadales bacterium]